MKNLYKQLGLLSLMCACITACKLDPPIFPDKSDTVTQQNNPGSSVTTGTTNVPPVVEAPITNPELTGTWTFKADYTEVFDASYNITKELSQGIAFYKTVQIDDSKHTAIFADPSLFILDTYTYTLSKGNDKSFIQFSADPFFRSANFRVEISSQTSGSMTWLIIDPKSIGIDGGFKGYSGHKVMFTR